MRILGIDPGSRATGYGIIEHSNGRCFHVVHGTIRTDDAAFPSRNAQSALKLGQVRGVLLLAAALNGMEIFEYSPMEIKKAITGYGRAEKEQIRYMVCTLLKLKSVCSLDASDALAVAICHAHAGQFQRRLS